MYFIFSYFFQNLGTDCEVNVNELKFCVEPLSEWRTRRDVINEFICACEDSVLKVELYCLTHNSLGLLLALKAPSPRRGLKAKCMWSPLSVFFQAKRR